MGILQVFIPTEEGSSEISFEEEKSSDCIKQLKSIRGDDLNRLVFTHLYINSIRNEFEFLVES